MTGAEYIAEFLARVGSDRVFLLTGGACAFMIDAVARHPKLTYTSFQHEQSAAMAADALWRVARKVGVSMATSGPGATNLITGIACSYFDSIPSLHITGQVNQRESSAFHGAKVRQSGFPGDAASSRWCALSPNTQRWSELLMNCAANWPRPFRSPPAVAWGRC